jgi:hypothetical protein
MNTELQYAIYYQLQKRDWDSGGEIEALREHVEVLQETLATLLTLVYSNGVIEGSELIDMLPNDWTCKVQEVINNEQ